MFVKGEHERQFAYEAHTACDKHGFVLGVEVTAGNIHDSVAWDKLYDDATGKFDVQFVTMDAGYKTSWIAKKALDDGKVPILPYTRYTGNVERVFADAKEKHAMRYTHHRGLAAVTRWVRLKFAAMNLKKLANWSWKNSFFRFIFVQCCQICMKSPASVC